MRTIMAGHETPAILTPASVGCYPVTPLDFHAMIFLLEFSSRGNYIMQTEWGSKLTIATLGIKPATAVKGIQEVNKKIPVARIYGRANHVRFQQDVAKGVSYLYFAGMFEGQNMLTGEMLQSNKLYLPDGVAEMVEDVVNKAQARDKNASVEFAVEIQVSPSSERTSGYEYHATFLKKPTAADELEMLRDLAAVKDSKSARKSA